MSAAPESRKRKLEAGAEAAAEEGGEAAEPATATATATAATVGSKRPLEEEGDSGQVETPPEKQKRGKVKQPFFSVMTGDALKLKAVQDLLINTFNLDGASSKDNAITIKNPKLVQRFCVLVVEGLGPALYCKYSTKLNSLTEFFPNVRPVTLPGNKQFVYKTLKSLLRCPLTRIQKESLGRQIQEAKKKADIALARQDRDAIKRSFLLNAQSQKEHLYPGPWDAEEAQQGYFKLEKEAADHQPLFAIDCEMVESAAGMELARVSMVNENCEQVLDMLVVPDNEIIDYHTKYSGITPELLATVTTTLKDVQEKLKELLPCNSIIIGHSLENDLRVLKLHHCFVIDTAVLFPDARGTNFKPALRWLVRQYLARSIQTGTDGHCSVEDAMACMHLVLNKMQNPLFGELVPTDESLVLRAARKGKRAAMLDTPQGLKPYSAEPADQLPCENDAEVAARFDEKAPWKCAVQWARFADLQNTLAQENVTDESVEQAVRELNERLQRVLDSVPPATAVVVIGSSDTSQVYRLHDRKVNKSAVEGWNQDLEKQLAQGVEVAKRGLLFMKCTSVQPA